MLTANVGFVGGFHSPFRAIEIEAKLVYLYAARVPVSTDVSCGVCAAWRNWRVSEKEKRKNRCQKGTKIAITEVENATNI